MIKRIEVTGSDHALKRYWFVEAHPAESYVAPRWIAANVTGNYCRGVPWLLFGN